MLGLLLAAARDCGVLRQVSRWETGGLRRKNPCQTAQSQFSRLFLFLHVLRRFLYLSKSHELDWILPPLPTLKIILQLISRQVLTSGIFFLFLSPPFAKISGFNFFSSAQILISFGFGPWPVKTTLSTHLILLIISARSFWGIKTCPFLFFSQLSLFKITTSLFPNFLASLNILT